MVVKVDIEILISFKLKSNKSDFFFSLKNPYTRYFNAYINEINRFTNLYNYKNYLITTI